MIQILRFSQLFFRLALVTLSLDLMPPTIPVIRTIFSCMPAFSTCSVSNIVRDYYCFTVTYVFSRARGGGHELLPAEGGGHGQGQPGQEEDHRVQSKDQIFSQENIK